MPPQKALFSKETLRFFRELGRNNRKEWMDENRGRYQEHIVQPFRALLETLTPAVYKLDAGFDVCGRTGTNFSRINRDIRFAKDKSPYRTQMYLMFPGTGGKGWQGGQLYVGISTDTATAGFRIYSDYRSKISALAQIARPRVLADPRWIARQKRRLDRKYESYWYSTEKREWTKHGGWPATPEEWKKLLGWIVRRKMAPSAATRPNFTADVAKIFRDLFPLFRFTSLRG
ncbi:MAG TPA: DUF2461 family protein [Candidatus Acidoferrales bacterium]|nr:DUF2461 family protein [Candidatus Acidoferrales bacterium]